MSRLGSGGSPRVPVLPDGPPFVLTDLSLSDEAAQPGPARPRSAPLPGARRGAALEPLLWGCRPSASPFPALTPLAPPRRVLRGMGLSVRSVGTGVQSALWGTCLGPRLFSPGRPRPLPAGPLCRCRLLLGRLPGRALGPGGAAVRAGRGGAERSEGWGSEIRVSFGGPGFCRG